MWSIIAVSWFLISEDLNCCQCETGQQFFPPSPQVTIYLFTSHSIRYPAVYYVTQIQKWQEHCLSLSLCLHSSNFIYKYHLSVCVCVTRSWEPDPVEADDPCGESGSERGKGKGEGGPAATVKLSHTFCETLRTINEIRVSWCHSHFTNLWALQSCQLAVRVEGWRVGGVGWKTTKNQPNREIQNKQEMIIRNGKYGRAGIEIAPLRRHFTHRR